MNKLEQAQDELLREATKNSMQICRVRHDNGDFVKARRGYSHPEELRTLYVQAFDELVRRGKIRALLRNKDLELYEVAPNTLGVSWVTSKRRAKEVILTEAQRFQFVYKVHSPDGEFVQVGPRPFAEIDEERILFLEALSELTRENKLELVADTRELTRFELKEQAVHTDDLLQKRAS